MVVSAATIMTWIVVYTRSAVKHRPQFIFAESVGSCTDLVATVVHPLLRFYPALKVVVTIFVDASLLVRRIKQSSTFSEDVEYIFEMQPQEADVLIINKMDLLNEEDKLMIQRFTASAFPGKVILFQDSRNSNDTKKVDRVLTA
jgi:G3E family GTPase